MNTRIMTMSITMTVKMGRWTDRWEIFMNGSLEEDLPFLWVCRPSCRRPGAPV